MPSDIPPSSPLARYPYRGVCTQIVRAILVINVAVWVALWALDALGVVGHADALAALALSPAAVTERLELWRLVSFAFVHTASPFSLVVSSVVLFAIGREVEELIGSRRFAALYAVAVLGIGGGALLIGRGTADGTFAAGAAGPALAVLIAFAGYRARDRFVLFRIFALETWLLAVIAIGLGVAGYVLDTYDAAVTSSSASLGVAHVIGAFVGLVWVRLHGRVESWLDRARRAPPTTSDEVPDTDIESEVDRILEKIAREGIQSLTPHERGLLDDASQHFRRRQDDD